MPSKSVSSVVPASRPLPNSIEREQQSKSLLRRESVHAYKSGVKCTSIGTQIPQQRRKTRGGEHYGRLLSKGGVINKRLWSKRIFDVTISCAAIIIILPLLLLIAILVHIDSPGPIFFRQTRLGMNGTPFRIIKFRTMNVSEDGPVIQQATRGDKRVTRIGYVLRRTSLDELPQILNVLWGDMSLVGPRPHALAHDSYYSAKILSYALRQTVRPGLTGWAQINGYRGETPSLDLMRKRIEHDLWYIENRTLLLDIRIVLSTFWVLIGARNAY